MAALLLGSRWGPGLLTILLWAVASLLPTWHQSPVSGVTRADAGVWSQPSGLAGIFPSKEAVVVTHKLGSGSQLETTGSFVFMSSLKSIFKKQQQCNSHIAILRNI